MTQQKPRWYARFVNRGDSAPRSTKSEVYSVDTTPQRTAWMEILTRKSRKVTEQTVIEGCTTTVITTVQPMTRDELKRETAAWSTRAREEQWRRLR